MLPRHEGDHQTQVRGRPHRGNVAEEQPANTGDACPSQSLRLSFTGFTRLRARVAPFILHIYLSPKGATWNGREKMS